jgi:probable rRNA maturation factor
MIEVSGSKAPLAKAKIEEIARAVLGARFSVSIVITNEKQMRALNKQWRKLDEPTDVLAFPLEKNEGEMFACPTMITKKFSKGIYPDYVTDGRTAFAFAVIHSLLHLAGYDHGSRMEAKEREFTHTFSHNGKTPNRSRNRHRNNRSKSGGSEGAR